MRKLFWNQFIVPVCLILILIAAPPIIDALQAVRPPPTARPQPAKTVPTDWNQPKTLTPQTSTADSAKQLLDQQNEIEMRLEVQRLYAIATELKVDVDSTDGNVTLNVTVLKRAQQIEKLAKQIRDRAKK